MSIAFADAGLRWLGANPPNLEEARRAFDLIMGSGVRAGEVYGPDPRPDEKGAPAEG
jgi:hypothetical protein